ncbi:Molybdate transporter [Seminavis robusta]|uniref:Molybdate transporter n=1 Tax=Seminavis robusta TaxID=568900 RepID=A0A9N8HHM9_9STRA|nr:Molybdate transporter [Seminavis robusta]|eukprot:Sro457_g146810.1 Molybdate transporter (568) ;mRNA; r:11164-13065
MDTAVLPIEEGTNNKKQTNTKEQQRLVALPSSLSEGEEEDEGLLAFSEHQEEETELLVVEDDDTMPKRPKKINKKKPLLSSQPHYYYFSSHFTNKWTTRAKELYSQLTIHEISGSVGDLGTFIPLAVALARQNAIALAPTLFWAGFANVMTGCAWDVPMGVQPMKAIAATAIAHELTNKTQVTIAGIFMGLFMIALSITKGIELVNWLVPTPVVSGIQMGVGINLAIRGLVMIQGLSWWSEIDCIGLALIVALACLYLLREPTTPAPTTTTTTSNENEESNSRKTSSAPPPRPVGLYLFGLGLVLAMFHLLFAQATTADTTPQGWQPIIVWALQGATWDDWKRGLLQGALPQLPLTTLNSVVSVCCLAHNLYPEKRKTTTDTDAVVSRREVSLSVGFMNLILCPLGAMPCCHGAGGLAGQHKFGARHGASVVFLGGCKMILALLLGKYLLKVLEALPTSILGLMLVVCGHELAVMGWTVLAKEHQSSAEQGNIPRKGVVVALLTVIVDVGLHKTHYAALTGWIAYMVYGDGMKEYAAQWQKIRSGDAGQYSPVARSKEGSADPLQVT